MELITYCTPFPYDTYALNEPTLRQEEHRSEKLITPEELGTWKITNKLIPRGFLFIWTEKELIPRVHASPAEN